MLDLPRFAHIVQKGPTMMGPTSRGWVFLYSMLLGGVEALGVSVGWEHGWISLFVLDVEAKWAISGT